MVLSAHMTVSQSPQSLTAEMGEEIVVMSVEKGVYFSLNPMATEIWRRMAQPCRIGDLCGVLEEEFDASAAEIEADVLALLEPLAEAGVVVVRS